MTTPGDFDDDLDDTDKIDDPLSLDQALPRLDRLVALFDDAAGRAGRGAEELRDLMLVAAFGPDAGYRYEQVFDFTFFDLEGAALATLVEWSPQGENYVTYGLTRVALGGRGYLVSWYTGDDDSRDWLQAGWSPATARALLRALRDQFRPRNADTPAISLGVVRRRQPSFPRRAPRRQVDRRTPRTSAVGAVPAAGTSRWPAGSHHLPGGDGAAGEPLPLPPRRDRTR